MSELFAELFGTPAPIQKQALSFTLNSVLAFFSRFVLDPESAMESVDPRVADVLFILSLTNSVVNPYVYGSYASETRWVGRSCSPPLLYCMSGGCGFEWPLRCRSRNNNNNSAQRL